MSQRTIREHISTIRGEYRLTDSDNRVTDRFIYSLMFRTREMLLKQSNQWLMKNHDIFQVIPKIDLIDVDVVEACGIQTNCKIKRSKDPLPKILEDRQGPIIKILSSMDSYNELVYTTVSDYLKKIKKTTFKYDKNLYFWVRNNHLYFPNIEWDNVMLEAYLEDDYILECDEQLPCKDYQDNLFRIPGYLSEPMSKIIGEKLRLQLQIVEDQKIDKNTNNK